LGSRSSTAPFSIPVSEIDHADMHIQIQIFTQGCHTHHNEVTSFLKVDNVMALSCPASITSAGTLVSTCDSQSHHQQILSAVCPNLLAELLSAPDAPTMHC
jgi:hypothetical protein